MCIQRDNKFRSYFWNMQGTRAQLLQVIVRFQPPGEELNSRNSRSSEWNERRNRTCKSDKSANLILKYIEIQCTAQGFPCFHEPGELVGAVGDRRQCHHWVGHDSYPTKYQQIPQLKDCTTVSLKCCSTRTDWPHSKP